MNYQLIFILALNILSLNAQTPIGDDDKYHCKKVEENGESILTPTAACIKECKNENKEADCDLKNPMPWPRNCECVNDEIADDDEYNCRKLRADEPATEISLIPTTACFERCKKREFNAACNENVSAYKWPKKCVCVKFGDFYPYISDPIIELKEDPAVEIIEDNNNVESKPSITIDHNGLGQTIIDK